MINIDLTKEKGLEINFTGQVIGTNGNALDEMLQNYYTKEEVEEKIKSIQGYTYISTATPLTTPITLAGDEKVFYIATEKGDYSNFGVYASGLAVIKSANNSWEVEDLGRYLLHTTGGTMKGNINMNGNRVDNVGIEEVNSLPTVNLYEGRMVRFKNKTYTFYNGLWLALSDDLRGHANDPHEENFVYQPTASDDLSVKDGFADIKKLKGNTVVWNQMFDYSNIITNVNTATYDNSTGIFTCTPVTMAFILTTKRNAKINHYHLISCEIKSDNNAQVSVWNGTLQPVVVSATSKWKKVTSIIKCTDDTKKLGVASQDSVNSFEVKNIKAFDLTQMFGEGNEPATVEEFEAIFPKDYYEYNEGELLSFDGKGVKSVGFNQWDEEWEPGKLNTTTGNNVEDTTRIRSKNYIKVFPSTKYYFTSPTGNNSSSVWIALYDKNYNIIQGYNGSGLQTSGNMFNIVLAPDRNREFTTSPNAAYMRFYISTEFNHDICINLVHSGYRNGEYEKYKDYTMLFQDGNTISQLTGKLNGEGESVTIFPDGLRSAGTVYDEIVYGEATGKHKAIKRIGSVDMGTLNYSYNNGSSNPDKYPYGFFTFNINNIKAGAYISTPHYIYMTNTVVGFKTDKSINNAPTAKTSYLIDSSYTDVASLKASLQGQILYYELAEPEVYDLDFPINTSYEAYDFGTEEVLYSDDKEVNIPMKANIEYGFNAVDMIRCNFEEIRSLKERVTALEQAILQIQATNTSTETPIEP